MAEIFNVLWTSGWDSTFRVAELALKHQKVVQPHYVNDWHRPSTQVELHHQGLILEEIARISPEAAARILPTEIHYYDEVPADPSVSERLERLAQKEHLGGQYDFLSRLASSAGVHNLELCVHKDDQAVKVIGNNVVHYSADAGGYYGLVTQPDDQDLELFRPFRFPLYDMTKVEMAERATQLGFDSVMELTWFCFHPTRQMTPCGFCNPCVYTRTEGLGRRVPERTPARWMKYMVRRKGGGLGRVLKRKITATLNG